MSIELDKKELIIGSGKSKQLTAVSEGEVTFKSSDKRVAIPDPSGRIYGYNPGVATIKASLEDSNDSVECTVSVFGCSLIPKETFPKIAVGQVISLEAIPIPLEAVIEFKLDGSSLEISEGSRANQITLTGVDLGVSEVTVEVTYESEVTEEIIEIEVVEFFTPIEDFSTFDKSELIVHDTESKLMLHCSGVPTMKVEGKDGTPTLYYVKNNENPLVFSYDVHVLSIDLVKLSLTSGGSGTEGPQGPAGPKGDTGAKGEKGDTGETGPQGAKGSDGAQGPQGAKGADGAKGDTGIQGPQGLKGDRGEVGPQGPKGDEGPQGPKGDPGTPA